MLLFRNDGGKAFEHYSEFMSTNVGIRTMDIVLFLGFLIHIVLAVTVWAQNRMARPVRYEVNRPSENSALSSRVMFFFSSRRRHTRYIGDWSSDVCSSDLRVPRFQSQPAGDQLLDRSYKRGTRRL